MPDYISWYIVELRQHLAGRLSPIRVEAISAEVDSHLREQTAELKAGFGMSEEQAAKTAIDAFGMPQKIAMDHLRMEGRKPLGLDPIWLVLGGALVAIACWDFHWASLQGVWDNFGETWQNGLAGVIGFAAIAVFLVGCRMGYRSYRLQLGALFGAVAAGLPFLLCAWMISVPGEWQGISRLHMARDTANVKGNIVKLGELQKLLKEGAAAFGKVYTLQTGYIVETETYYPNGGPSFSPIDKPEDFIEPPSKFVVFDRKLDPAVRPLTTEGFLLGTKGHRYVVPYGNGVFSMVDGRLYGLDFEKDLTKAAELWHRNAQSSIASATKQQQDFKRLLAAVAEAQQGRIFFYNTEAFVNSVCGTIALLPFFLIADTIMFALTKRRRYRRGLALA